MFKNYLLFLLMFLLLASCFDSAEEESESLFSGHTPTSGQFTFVEMSDQSYIVGESINIVLSFPSSVTVTGTPRLALDIGGTTRNANYSSGSGTKLLTFKYTVQSGDNDSDGIDLPASITLNSGTLKYTNNGVISDASTTIKYNSSPELLVDTTAPTITTIVPPVPDNYYEGEILSFTVSFSEDVNVSGTPQLHMDIGGITQSANLVSSSGTSATFQYTVQSTDSDADGILSVSPLNLNGGSIADDAGNAADLTFALPDTSLVFVSGDVPYVTEVTAPTNQTYYLNEVMDLTLEFSQTVDVTGNPRVPVDIGGQTAYFTYDSGSGTTSLIFKHSVNTGEIDLDGIELTSTIDLNSGTIQSTSAVNAELDMPVPSTPNVLVDAEIPYVTSITPQTDGTYATGQDIYFIVNFNRAVTVTGSVQMPIDLQSGTVNATYYSGSNSANIMFRWTVTASDIDSDGLQLQNALNLVGGSIQANNGIDANLDITTAVAALDTSGVLINPSNVTITSITPPADDTYIETEYLDFIVNTSTNITVTGTPRIAIDIGGTTKYANYLSGTGTSALTFRYTVEAGLYDNDGVAITSPIDLNSGTMQDGSSNNLDLTFTSPDLSNVLVDSTPPTIAITSPAEGDYINIANNTSTYTISGTCSESGETITIQVDSGAATSPVGFSCDGTNFTGTIDVTGLTEAAHTLDAEISDAAGNSTTATTINVTKDITQPTVTAVTPPSDGNFATGASIDFTVTYSENVDVTNTPRIAVDIGGTTRYADYQSGTGTTALVFSYTVDAADSDLDGISWPATTIDLNTSGTIQDIAANDASLDMSSFAPDLSNVLVNAFYITSITPPTDNTYIETETLTFVVNTNTTATVSGTPRLVLDIGGTTKYANYVSGTGSTALTFTYTVEAGLNDQDGIEITSPLDENGGSIQDVSSVNLATSFTAPDTSAVLVDSLDPTIEITTPAEGDYINIANNTSTYTVSGNCSENGQSVTIQVDSGAATSPVGFVCDGANFTGTIDVTGLTEAAHTLDAEISDAASNTATATTINVTKDVTAPSITAVTPPADSNYSTGSNLDFTVSYSEAVDVTNTPRIALNIGGITKYATYQSGSGTTDLLFRYLVDAADTDIDGIALSSNNIDMNGTGTIKDVASNNAAVDMTAFAPDLSNVLVNAFYITSVTPPADSTYAETETLTLMVNTNANATVTGTPRIAIDIGGTTKYATYQTGSGSTALTFEYTVEAGLSDNDGITLTSPLDLNGGTIQDASSVDLSLTYTLPDTSGVLVDSLLPSVEITSPSDGDYINISNNTSTYTISGTCSENTQTVTILVDGGAATSPVGFLCDGTNFTGTIDVTGLTEAAHTFVASISDGTNTSNSTTINVTKDVTAPSVTGVTPPADNNYGTAANLDFSVDYSDNVTVTNTPRIAVDIGGTTRYATYLSGSGTSTLLFRYIIDGSDQDSDGITWPSNNIDLNTTGTIQDVAANDASLDMSAHAPDLSNVVVNNLYITSVTGPANATYTDGEDLTFTVNTSDNVTVTGTPRLTLDIGGTTKYATYQSGSGSSALVFTYNVEDGLSDDDGVGLSSPLDLNSGTIQDGSSINLLLTFSSPDLSGVLVDSLDPTLTLVNPANASYINSTTDSASFGITGTCNDATAAYTVKIDGVSNGSASCDGTNLTGSFDSTALTEAAHTIVIEADDGSNPVASSATHNFTRDVTAPTITISPAATDITNTNVSSYSLGGSCSGAEDGQTVNINIGGTTFSTTCSSGSWSMTEDVSGIADNATLAITADVDDVAGNSATQATDTVSKDTTAPTISITTADTVNLTNYTSYTISGNCTGAEDGQTITAVFGGLAANTTATCSSGTYTISGWNVSGEADNASITITVDVSDASGNAAPQASTTVIKDTVAPAITSVTPPTLQNYVTDDSYSYSFTFDDTVNVTGTPQVNQTFDSGGTTVAYLGGSGSTTISFNYVVLAADIDVGPVEITSPLALNGGSITDLNGNPATLTFTPPTLTGMTINQGAGTPSVVWRDSGGTEITSDDWGIQAVGTQVTYQVYNNGTADTTDLDVKKQGGGKHDLISTTCGTVLTVGSFCEAVVEFASCQGPCNGGVVSSTMRASQGGINVDLTVQTTEP